jgi:hypothetical protein
MDRVSDEEGKNMDSGFERSSEKVLIWLLSVFVAVSLLFCTAAEAVSFR